MTATRPEKIRPVAKTPMIKRTYYVPRDLYEAALAKTDERDEDLADVIRRALLAYVEER